ncbi:hypothetical protein SAMN05444398_11071 [Roseovarius pacificus]|uniref:Uncharacterized protein n=1 Tax=Roseovarius pacificus TaxID=337701 RepID=A0A1M7GA70_9RHOB|nr:hypothetical protein SAMN05444398_11071 [Roseovarius pacificus]
MQDRPPGGRSGDARRRARRALIPGEGKVRCVPLNGHRRQMRLLRRARGIAVIIRSEPDHDIRADHPCAGPPTITQSSSNMIDTPRKAVPPEGSKGGETSTMSAPTMVSPASSRTTCKA